MANDLTQSLYQPYQDLDGSPLEAGYLYFGTENLNPETNPITVYWDAAGTQPAAQPIRTVAGLPSRNGSPGMIFAGVNYSITVRNRANVLVYSAQSSSVSFFGFIKRLASSIGGTLVGVIQAGAGAVLRTVQDFFRERVSVKDFGAVGDGVTNDRDAIQACLDYVDSQGGGMDIYFPYGIYVINSALSMISNVRFRGVGGYTGSMIKGTHAGDLLAYSLQVEAVELYGMSFSGAGCTAIHQLVAGVYTSMWRVHSCHFHANLNTCIRGNLILCDIGPDNTFGYYGTPGVSLSHIVSLGDPAGTGNTTNVNRIHGNRFFNARGAGVGVSFDAGFKLEVYGNDFESNSVPPLTINGMYTSHVHDNWMENNNIVNYVTMANASAGGNANLVAVFEGNHIAAHATMTAFISHSGAGVVSFKNNTGTGWAGKTVTNGPDGFVGEFYNNSLSGYAGTLVNQLLLGAILDTGGTNRQTITGDGRFIHVASQNVEIEGAAIASASALSPTFDGNEYHVTGATAVNRIDASGYATGSAPITFIFDSAITINHGVAASGGLKGIKLSGSANWAAPAGSSLTVRYSPSSGFWWEIGRMAA